MESRFSDRIQDRLIHALLQMVQQARDLEHALAPDIRQIEADYRDSARNLIHYLSVRQHDIRKLQDDLSSLGLSSLGRLEAHALASLLAVLETLQRLAGREPDSAVLPSPPASFRMGPMMLQDHATALLGRSPPNRAVRIMVTMPSEAANSPDLIARLLEAGMDVMRVNCAHDSPEAWQAMIRNLRYAEKRVGKRCRVLADLAGPKLRTGALPVVDKVQKIRPRRDYRGSVLEPARVWFTPMNAPVPAPADSAAILRYDGMIQVQQGDVIELEDTRDRFRRLTVTAVDQRSFLAELRQTTYVPEYGQLRMADAEPDSPCAKVVDLPAVVAPIVLRAEDRLVLTRDKGPGEHATVDAHTGETRPARIGCSLDAVFQAARPGEPVWFDDGKIGGVIESNDGNAVTVRITRAKPQGSRLLADKGINLPETDLQVPALTDRDFVHLQGLVEHIDMVGLSFVRRPEDVLALEDRLHELGAGHLGIVLKIENRLAFENLPKLLLAGLRSPPIGIMVARGDLAVELGFERLSEVQEQILWICEAAHVPVIWATQVLEDMAKTGMPSRAEVTDAAMSGRAECVMLNKGPYVVDVVDFLSGVLERMESHQTKKSAMLRRLSISDLKAR